MAISRLQFMLFYSVLLLFIIMVSGMAGQQILMAEGVENLPQPTGAWWEAFTLPMTYFFSFLFISSDYTLIFSLIILPFVIGLVLIIAEMARGN